VVMGYVLLGEMVGGALVFSLGQSFYLEGKCTGGIYLENLVGGKGPLEELQSSA